MKSLGERGRRSKIEYERAEGLERDRWQVQAGVPSSLVNMTSNIVEKQLQALDAYAHGFDVPLVLKAQDPGDRQYIVPTLR